MISLCDKFLDDGELSIMKYDHLLKDKGHQSWRQRGQEDKLEKKQECADQNEKKYDDVSMKEMMKKNGH